MDIKILRRAIANPETLSDEIIKIYIRKLLMVEDDHKIRSEIKDLLSAHRPNLKVFGDILDETPIVPVEEEGPIIELPKDPELVALLVDKLIEFRSYLDNDYKPPEQQCVTKLTVLILSQLLAEGRVVTRALGREMGGSAGHRVYRHGRLEVFYTRQQYEQACGIIDHLCRTGELKNFPYHEP